MRAGRVFVLVAIATLPAAGIHAAPPPPITQIRLDGPDNGFVAVSEVVTPEGAVIDTFRSGDVTLRVIGSPGSRIKAAPVRQDAAGRLGVAFELAASRPKRLSDADRYARSGRTVVGDLIALGMPPDEARRQFGDMDVPDPEAAAATRLLASSSVGPGVLAELAAAPAPSTSKPYDTQCASVTYQGGSIEGYGCSTIYLIAASGTDWWFNNKFKFSARSTDGGAWWCTHGSPSCPWRLVEVGWSLAWATNNILYDWDPSSALDQKECSSVSIGASYHGYGISVSGTICPERIQPWNLAARRSGAEWTGIERGNTWEAAMGIQAIHSPPGAAASYNSPFSLIWARLNT